MSWLLILVIYSGYQQHTVTAIPGFGTEAECTSAGIRSQIFNQLGTQTGVMFLCAKQMQKKED